MTPTARTLAWLRKEGYTAAVVEKWNCHTRIRQDLFGFADVLAFRQGEWLLVQATSGSNTSSRVAKITANDTAKVWIDSGGRILVVGWRELVAYRKDGTKAARKRWIPKIIEVEL